MVDWTSELSFFTRLLVSSLLKKNKTGFELAIRESWFVDQLCLFVYHFKQFFVKFVNQNFPLVRIFDFWENMKSLFKLQTHHIPAYLKL